MRTYKYIVNQPIGKVKHSISYWDGAKTNKDGSPFWDLRTYKTKKDLDNAIKEFTL